MKKTIIVPTDYSDNALNALHYAVNFANQFDQATIHLLHVFAARSEVGIMASVNMFMKNNIDKQLSTLVDEVKPGLLESTRLISKAIEGYPISTICQYAEEQQADYIIMGTKGASGLKSVFLGSNTSGVMKKSKHPVLAIPSDYRYRPPLNIALAIDAEIVSTEDVLMPMIEIAKKLRSKVEVVHVKGVKELAVIDAGVDIYLSDINHSFHVVRGNDVNKEINQFVHENKMEMLCMIQRRHSFFHRLVFASLTEEEMFNCQVPLLVLNDR